MGISKSDKYHTESLQEVLLSVATDVFCKFDSRHSKFLQSKFFWGTSVSGWVHSSCYLAFRKCPPWGFLLFLQTEKKNLVTVFSVMFVVLNTRNNLKMSAPHLYYHELIYCSPTPYLLSQTPPDILPTH